MLKQVNRQPKTGTFVAVWEYEGEVYCEKFTYINNRLYSVEYRENEKDKYTEYGSDWNRLLTKVKYFISE